MGAHRVGQLRAELAKLGLAGFIVPRADEHQNEYVPANAERLRWLTGFAGSAGLAVVLKDTAALFVDGRYTEQVKSEADASVFEFRRVPEDAAERMDRGPAQSRATSLVMTPDFTRPRLSRDIRPLARKRAPVWSLSTRTQLTRSGLIGRPRRSARSLRTSCNSRAKARPRRSPACGRPWGRRTVS